MKRMRRSHRRKDVAELNVTAFMNLMVVLVPFLLITAVFSQVTILELNLPTAAQNAAQSKKRELQLEVVVRKDELMVADRSGGPLKRLRRNGDQYPYADLTKYLEQIKSRFPDKEDITLLLDPDVPYDTLVQVMDAVRVTSGETGALRGELFPRIAIGDAPQRNN